MQNYGSSNFQVQMQKLSFQKNMYKIKLIDRFHQKQHQHLHQQNAIEIEKKYFSTICQYYLFSIIECQKIEVKFFYTKF